MRARLFAILLACAATMPAETAPVVQGPETVAPAADPRLAETLAALAAASAAAGLPDPAGCELLVGRVELLRTEPKRMRVSSSGVHLRRPDGTLLIGGDRLAATGVEVNASNLRTPVPDTDFPAERRKQALAWMQDEVNPADRDRLDPLLDDIGRFLLTGLGHIQQSGGGHLMLLARMHHPQAALAARVAVVARLNQSETEGVPPLVTEQSEGPWRMRQMTMEGNRSLPADQRPRLPDAATTARRQGVGHLISLALGSTPDSLYAAVDPDRIFAAAAQLAGPDDQTARERIAGLRAALAIPAETPAGADLGTRLAGWKPADEATDDEDLFAGGMPGMGEEEKPPMEPGADDPAALVALLADRRPSRWIDHGWPRCVGDCALRILSQALACDPRRAVGHDPTAPWTADERDATATALAGWWKAQAGKPLPEIRLGLLRFLTPPQLVQRLMADNDEARKPLLDQLAVVWTKPPDGLDDGTLATVLAVARGHSALRDAVLAWPVDGPAVLTLAVLHAGQGDRARLDAMIADAFAGKTGADGPDDDRRLRILTLIRSVGNDGQVRQLLQAVTTLPEDADAARRWQGLVQTLLWGDRGDALTSLTTMTPGNSGSDRSSAVSLACAANLLADERPLPSSLAGFVGEAQMMASDGPAQGKPASDLRVCDIAGTMFGMLAANAAQELGIDRSAVYTDRAAWTLDLAQERQVRDQRLAKFRTLLAERLPPLLQAAKLALPVPGVGAGPKGDDKALF